VDLTQWISTAASLCGIAGFLSAVVCRWIKRHIRRLENVTQVGVDELTPGPAQNGSRSLRDDVTAILAILTAQGADQIDIRKRLKTIAAELHAHVREGHHGAESVPPQDDEPDEHP